MKYKIIIRPEAENDLKEDFSWYEDKREGLGHNFLLQVEAGLKFIEINPEACPSEYKGARKHFIKRFPYKIIYLLEGETIIVLAVIHGKISSNIIKNRIDKK